MADDWSRLARQVYNNHSALARAVLYKLSLVSIAYDHAEYTYSSSSSPLVGFSTIDPSPIASTYCQTSSACSFSISFAILTHRILITKAFILYLKLLIQFHSMFWMLRILLVVPNSTLMRISILHIRIKSNRWKSVWCFLSLPAHYHYSQPWSFHSWMKASSYPPQSIGFSNSIHWILHSFLIDQPTRVSW